METNKKEKARTHWQLLETHRAKREDKAVKELNADLKKMKVEVDQKAVGRRQTETLNHIFATYFRVVKHGRDSPLLPCVLQGLSRHAHLIDAAFFGP